MLLQASGFYNLVPYTFSLMPVYIWRIYSQKCGMLDQCIFEILRDTVPLTAACWNCSHPGTVSQGGQRGSPELKM